MRTFVVALALVAVTLGAGLSGQQDPTLYAGLKWRSIGPFRAGRVSAVAGVAGDPAVYYIGTPGGGVWQTTDGGAIWRPISDAIPVASIGALAVAPSSPNIIYMGTGDVSEVGGSVNAGDGVYRSIDAGATWTHVGLERSWHIGALWIDPHDANIVVVAALGHTFAKDADRGIFKTTDGGATWRKTLYKDDETGAVDVAFDAANPKVGFAALWGHYIAPGGSVLNGTNRGALYKTTDEGDTWTIVEGHGFPADRVGRVGVAVVNSGRRVFAIVAAQPGAGLYRSDDGGTTWEKATSDPRIVGSGYFGKVYVDPKNADVVYVMQTSMYRSTDGGRSFDALKGAPGGDDNHVLWIDPTNSKWMIMGSDQGAVVSMDGGRTWSSWYNQPTGQLYHLSTDNRWPYWIYGMQQDSGSIGTRNRGDYGNVGILDWDAVAGYEFGYIIPDPLNPNLVYAGGEARGVWRLDRTSRQVRTVSPNVSRNGDYRTAVNPPLVFSPHDPHALYEGLQVVLVTRNGGDSWQHVSPDLTIRPDLPASTPPRDAAAGGPPPNRSAITTLAPSPVRDGVLWAGTSNGLVHVTEDAGKSWRNVSPPGLTRFHQISTIEASHFDAATAYAAVDGHETNDFAPHIFRTHDFGKTWQETIAGVPASRGGFLRVVREDPLRRGLLYAGTENGALVSFDDGEHWQSLQLNLPTVSVRDIVVHDQDVVVCTYGRAIWILDDVTPLRQANRSVSDADAFLFAPHQAIRVRRNDNNDTPIPPDLPAADNPPAGAVVDYFLRTATSGDVTLGIYDKRGELVRELSSAPEAATTDEPPSVPAYWLAKPTPLSKAAGMSRAVWDLRYPAPPALRHDYPISANLAQTPRSPEGPLAPPGTYEVRLRANGTTYRQPLTVVADPRVHVPQADFDRQAAFELSTVSAMRVAFDGDHRATDLRKVVAERARSLESSAMAKPALDAVKAFDQKIGALVGEQPRGAGAPPVAGRPRPSFSSLNGNLSALLEASDLADGAPTEAMTTAWSDYCRDLSGIVQQWNELTATDLPAINTHLRSANLPALAASPIAAPSCGVP